MTDRGEREKLKNVEPEDMLVVVERMRSVPRCHPRLIFRVRVALCSLFPKLAAGRTERRVNPRGSKAWSPALRLAAGAAIGVLVLLIVFTGLTVASRSTGPGDSLYFLKRASEKLDLAFTWDSVRKARKNLNLADSRLTELDHLIEKRSLDTEKITEAAGDYAARTLAVTRMLRQESGVPAAGEIAKRFDAVKTREQEIEKRLAAAAGPESTLAPATGALVTVTDTSGRRSIGPGNSVFNGRVDGKAEFAFSVDLENREAARGLEARVELDGRTVVVPVFPEAAASQAGQYPSYTAKVEPEASIVRLDKPQLFTLTLTGHDVASAANRQVRLRETTSTGLINGSTGEAGLVTDYYGRCSFTFTKTSTNRVSRITLKVLDGTWSDLGEVMVVGGVKTPEGNTDAGGVVVKSSGPAAGPQRIDFDNGLVHLTAGGTVAGRFINNITRVGMPGKAGPLDDPAVAGEGGVVPAGVKVTGPRLLFANREAAGYEVEYLVPSGNGSLRKTHRVILEQGNAYATINSTLENVGDNARSDNGTGSSLEIVQLQMPAGSQTNVSGRPGGAATIDKPFQVDFDPGRPYAAYNSAGSWVVLACPVDSDIYPDAWTVGDHYIGADVERTALLSAGGRSLTTLIGITEKQNIESLVEKARKGSERPDAAAGEESAGDEGFFVGVAPVYNNLKKGRQHVTLTILKRYQKVFEH